jgi:hypothetical protein
VNKDQHCIFLIDILKLTEVADVHDGVKPRLHEDEDSDELVDVDVVVERQQEAEAQFAKFCHGVPVNEQ